MQSSSLECGDNQNQQRQRKTERRNRQAESRYETQIAAYQSEWSVQRSYLPIQHSSCTEYTKHPKKLTANDRPARTLQFRGRPRQEGDSPVALDRQVKISIISILIRFAIIQSLQAL